MKDKGISIAVIDDDDTFQFITSKALKSLSSDAVVIQFNSGVEAMKYLVDNAENEPELPSVLLVDINMPVLDGWMLLDEFKVLKNKLKKEIAFYLVSSSIDELDINRAKDDELVKDYLLKPLSISTYQELLSI